MTLTDFNNIKTGDLVWFKPGKEGKYESGKTYQVFAKHKDKKAISLTEETTWRIDWIDFKRCEVMPLAKAIGKMREFLGK